PIDEPLQEMQAVLPVFELAEATGVSRRAGPEGMCTRSTRIHLRMNFIIRIQLTLTFIHNSVIFLVVNQIVTLLKEVTTLSTTDPLPASLKGPPNKMYSKQMNTNEGNCATLKKYFRHVTVSSIF